MDQKHPDYPTVIALKARLDLGSIDAPALMIRKRLITSRLVGKEKLPTNFRKLLKLTRCAIGMELRARTEHFRAPVYKMQDKLDVYATQRCTIREDKEPI
jgi:hypothetical protein